MTERTVISNNRRGRRDNCTMTPAKRATVAALAVLAAAISFSTPIAVADPDDDYNDGLAKTICQLLDSGWSKQKVAAELAASMPSEIMAGESDGLTTVRWAIDRDCPEHA